MPLDSTKPLDATDRDLLLAALADAESAWSLGAFGAAAEFRRHGDEAFSLIADVGAGVLTQRGGIALTLPAALRPVAYEMPVGGGWSHAIALCLSAADLRGVTDLRFTEIGPDRGALDPARRAAPGFDLGLGLAQARMFIRTNRPAALRRLRAREGGESVDFDAAIRPEVEAGDADLVVVGPLGRIEVLGGGLGDPFGPRAYVVPKILRSGRTHVATAPIPPGLVPVAHLFPPHPCRDLALRSIPFDRARHEGFQALLARWGDPAGVARKVERAAGLPTRSGATDRRGRAIDRVVRAQSVHLSGAP